VFRLSPTTYIRTQGTQSWILIGAWGFGTIATDAHFGYGEADGMADGYRKVLTDVLDPSSVYTLKGGHKWTTWKPLWEQIAASLER
jgi:hypothetical protein